MPMVLAAGCVCGVTMVGSLVGVSVVLAVVAHRIVVGVEQTIALRRGVVHNSVLNKVVLGAPLGVGGVGGARAVPGLVVVCALLVLGQWLRMTELQKGTVCWPVPVLPGLWPWRRSW